MPSELPNVPVPDLSDPLYAPFWEGTRAHRLRIQCCRACGKKRWPPRYMCPICSSFDIDWVDVEPSGTLFSWTIVGFATAKGYPDVPYAVGIVTLDHAPEVRVVGKITAVDLESLRAGLPLKARFVTAGPEGEMTVLEWTAP